MSSHRGLRPAVGIVLCIGTGCAAAVLSDADSESRRRISSRASEVRREVLLRALSKQTQRLPAELRQQCTPELTTVSVSSATEPEGVSKRFYVVTGPDADLTSLARERISRALLSSDNTTNRASQREAAPALPLPARLVVPYDCVLGTERFSLLVEQQLLCQLLQDSPLLEGEEDLYRQPLQRQQRRQQRQQQQQPQQHQHQHQQHQQQQQQQQNLESHDYNVADDNDNHSDTTGDRVLSSKQGPSARAPPTAERTLIITNWESFLLRATLPFMNAEQLDQAALWALESALSATSTSTSTAVAAADQCHTSTASGNGKESSGATGLQSVSSKSRTQIHAVNNRSSFVLEIAWSARECDDEGTVDEYEARGASIGQEGNSSSSSSSSNIDSSRMLCGELARWGWRLAARGLGHAIISSPNPWVLAEVQRALQAEGKDPISGLSQGQGAGSSDGRGAEGVGDASSVEVAVVRVALPSAAEREQAVVSVARELGVNGHLSALDVSKLAELTGGRRAGLLDALGRVRGSSTGKSFAEACQAVVDDRALSLASSWGLLPHNSDSLIEAEEGREEWAPLWEALGVLSMPPVSVGTGEWSRCCRCNPPKTLVH
ncbi:unnamed protein product, partial [Laminaria digitata]